MKWLPEVTPEFKSQMPSVVEIWRLPMNMEMQHVWVLSVKGFAESKFNLWRFLRRKREFMRERVIKPYRFDCDVAFTDQYQSVRESIENDWAEIQSAVTKSRMVNPASKEQALCDLARKCIGAGFA